MKKNSLIILMLLSTLSMFALQTVTVRVWSNAAATCTVIVADQCINEIERRDNVFIIQGYTNVDFHIADSYDPTELYCDVYGSTSWGSWQESGLIQEFYSGRGIPYPTCYVTLSFEIPVNLSVFVYSNLKAINAEISIKNQATNYTYKTVIQDFDEGWNEVDVDEVWGESFDVTTCYAEIDAECAGGESYTLVSTDDFVLNQTTHRYENHDIEFYFDNKEFHDGWNWESFLN